MGKISPIQPRKPATKGFEGGAELAHEPPPFPRHQRLPDCSLLLVASVHDLDHGQLVRVGHVKAASLGIPEGDPGTRRIVCREIGARNIAAKALRNQRTALHGSEDRRGRRCAGREPAGQRQRQGRQTPQSRAQRGFQHGWLP